VVPILLEIANHVNIPLLILKGYFRPCGRGQGSVSLKSS